MADQLPGLTRERLRALINPFREPFAPGRHLARPMQAFVHTEAAGGIVLLAATLIALAWANSPWDAQYAELWERGLNLDTSFVSIDEDLGHLVNDGLMVIFFFVVGLEIKRELVHGELATPRRALLPVAAAFGGMVLPALIFFAWNGTGDGAKGWGIPMATDIAFALGVLALLGRRIPFSLKVFLLALAIVDDLGAILVIALFYSDGISMQALAWAGAVLAVILAVRAGGVRSTDVYVLLGICLWLAVLKSGIHATVAGVGLAMLTPARPRLAADKADRAIDSLLGRIQEAREEGDSERRQVLLRELERISRDAESPLDRLESVLHPWVSFVIIPLFALANAGLALDRDILREAATSPVSLGIGSGLIFGKCIGIAGATWLTVRLGLSQLPEGMRWNHVIGAAMLGGIGFTVSLFITGLAYKDAPLVAAEAKIGILFASAFAAVAGFTWLRLVTRDREPVTHAEQQIQPVQTR